MENKQENDFYVDSDKLSEKALAKKHMLENDPSSRKSHMEYLEGMEQIKSDILEKVISEMDSYDYSKYTARDVKRALDHDKCSIEDLKAFLSPAAEPFLEEMADTGNKWYVLKAVSGKEAKVKEYIEAEMKHNDLLAANVSQVLIPLEKHASVRNGKRVVKEKVSLPGYVFVEARLKGDVAHTLRFMPNVLGFLGGLDEPTPVPQRDINRMLGTVEETEFEENLDCPYLVNDTVKVMEGPFSGFSGVIEEVNLEKRKLKVTVKIFGRKTPLELGFMQVEKE